MPPTTTEAAASSPEPLEAVVQLRRTSRTRASDAPGVPDAADVLRRANVDEDQPFILGPDGSYDLQLNRCLRELDGWGVRSENGRLAYSRDIMLFCRFLHESRGGKSIWECDGADLRAYKVVRLRTPGPHQVTVGTWNRSIAALDKWVQWAIYEGLLAGEPFRYVDKTVLTPQGLKQVRVNDQHEDDPEDAPPEFVSMEDYLLWRDVGLRGELPEGRPDPSWRGRHGERNAMFADTLVHTGMRLGEGASLLISEVPPLHGARLVGDVRLSAAVTKRGKRRTVYLPKRVLRALHHFVEIERDELVQRVLSQGGYPVLEGDLLVARAGRHALRLLDTSKAWSYNAIGAADRQRLLRVDSDGVPAGPLWLWLGDEGQPLQPSTWQSAFRRANQRCAKFGIPTEIHPHTLRHVYAVHMLGLLLRQTLRELGRPENASLARAEIRRLLIGNPMRRLQLLLGHSQESTVYTYLDVLDDAQDIVLAALAEWDAQIAALEAVKPGAEAAE
ncbi:tyrosine-type recombinase/integrase [Nonomuraea guangzhouensis]|uniref:Tyrosine-type recombinase/integrase n=1 Tax=Nonomuraea guangzhouensis TaxID=1291555 RepID=A0ABW4GC95_9ACTN|nr:tyrosine-type recombinase/integrase [Nonomuraea guangzhouensis]